MPDLADDKAKSADLEGQNKQGEGQDKQLEARVSKLDEKLDKILAGLDKKPSDDFDPIKLLKDLEQEDEPRSRGGTDEASSGELDFEKMTPKEFAKFVVNSTLGEVQRALKPIVDRVEVLRVRSEVREAQDKYPDFMDFKDDIFKIAMNNPSLSIEDAYLQVAGRSSIKARREAAAEEAEEKKKKEENESSRRTPFLPSDRGGHDRRATKEEPADLEGAVVLALRDVMGQEK